MPTDLRQHNFILQQGFEAPAPEACGLQYASLQFQPRVVGALVLAGVALQSPTLFGTLAALLWWGAAFPAANLFEAAYNRLLRPQGAARLAPAPAPRRFAQALAGSFAAAIALCLAGGHGDAAWALEGILLAAVAALVFGGFCLGSFLFHLLRRRVAFALGTLPWSRR